MNRKNTRTTNSGKNSKKIKLLKVTSRKAGKAFNKVSSNVVVAGGLLSAPVYEFLYW